MTSSEEKIDVPNIAIWYKQLFAQLIDVIVIAFMTIIFTLFLSEDSRGAWLNTLGSGIGVQISGFSLIMNFFDNDLTNDNNAINTLFGGIIIGLLHGIIEIITKGKSLGKYLLGLQVVNKHGMPVGFILTIARNLLKLIPFSLLSYLGKTPRGFHNLICGTKVIDIISEEGKIIFFNSNILTNNSIINNAKVFNINKRTLFKHSESFDKENINSLKELHELKEKGVITEDEFIKMKSKIINE